MSHPPSSAFKETQLFDWDAEPSLERPSTQFPTEGADLPHPAARRRSRGGRGWMLAVGLAVAAGGVALIQVVPLIHQHLHGPG